MICADMRYPELARELAVEHGVDLILHPCAFSRDASFCSWHQFVIARALENQVYWLSLNYSGKSFGASIFAPPWIDSTTTATVGAQHAECCICGLVDTEVIAQARAQFPFRANRKESYGTCTKKQMVMVGGFLLAVLLLRQVVLTARGGEKG